jgi:Ca-activated chloride channel family protein
VFDLDTVGQSLYATDVLLITDGETWEREKIVRLCRDSHHRVFVIGCGACPAESVVREIAEATGGAAVFVGPNEDVAGVIDSHLQRMRQPRITSATLFLPGQLWCAPNDLTRCTFAGNTLHVFSALKAAIAGPLELQLTFAGGREQKLIAQLKEAPTAFAEDLLRVGVATRIRETLFNEAAPNTVELTQLAVKHQLISPFTHYVMVEQRGAEAAVDDPELRQVSGMLAAGWGGTGVIEWEDYLDIPAFLRRKPKENAVTDNGYMVFEDYSELSVRSTLPDYATGDSSSVMESPRSLIERLNADFSLLGPARGVRLSLAEIEDLCVWGSALLDDEIRYAFDEMVGVGWSEKQIMLAFWQALLKQPELSALFKRSHRRAVLRALRDNPADVSLTLHIVHSMRGTTADEWTWASPVYWPSCVRTERQVP